MYIHGRLADLSQMVLPIHIVVCDIGSAGIHITDIGNGKDI